MRKRPEKDKLEEKFIKSAPTEKIEKENTREDLHKYVKSMKWPMEEINIEPSMALGSNLAKPINISLKEYEWNTIDRHTKTIKVAKATWIKYAMLKLLQEEQLYCFKAREKK